MPKSNAVRTHLWNGPEETTRTDWCTPPEIVNLVHEVFGGPPDLDPCSNAGSIVQAKVNVCLPENGLNSKHWEKAETVFINPPYGVKNGENDFLGAAGLFSGFGTPGNLNREVLGLVPCKTDGIGWHSFVWPYASAILFFKGRIKFLGASATAKFPMALIYWGPDPKHFKYTVEDHGEVVLL